MRLNFSQQLKKLSDQTELLIVLAICFSYPIITSFISLLSGKAFTKVEFNDNRLLFSLSLEFVFSAICITFLWLRGYRIWERINFSPTIKETFIAAVLFISSYAAYIILFILAIAIVGRENLKIASFSFTVNIFLVIAVSIINPLFEETFVLAYIFDKLQTTNVWTVIFVSTLIRTSYHLYQGWIGILSILPMGIIFAFAYSRRKNLWSVYLAHFAMDLFGLMRH